jgi:hypothetical protein
VSVALRVTVTGALYGVCAHAEPLHLIVVAGGVLSGGGAEMLISCERTASTLPAMSQERYFTVVVLDTVNAPEYVGLERVGSVPSVV